MKIYLIRKSMRGRIKRIEAEPSPHDPGVVGVKVRDGETLWYGPRDWAETKEDALALAERNREERIQHFRRRIDALSRRDLAKEIENA